MAAVQEGSFVSCSDDFSLEPQEDVRDCVSLFDRLSGVIW